jgi:hypothetical protein
MFILTGCLIALSCLSIYRFLYKNKKHQINTEINYEYDVASFSIEEEKLCIKDSDDELPTFVWFVSSKKTEKSYSLDVLDEVENYEKDFEGRAYLKIVDIEKQKNLIDESKKSVNEIVAIPVGMMFVKGVCVKEIQGFLTSEELLTELNEFLPERMTEES